jgi:hypothetical protein
MAHFAEIGENNLVLRVIVVDNKDTMDTFGVEQEEIGAEFCRNLLGGTWKQTSYNSSFRKNYAGFGFTYDSVRDAFVPPKPYPSWVLNEATCQWEAPVPKPDDVDFPTRYYRWQEETLSWIEIVL